VRLEPFLTKRACCLILKTGGSDLENFLGGLKPEKWGPPARFGDLFSGALLRRDLLTGFAFRGLADEEGEGLREESGAG
jgi:hypothetical protein